MYNTFSQAEHYPGIHLKDVIPKAQFKGVSAGGMISSTKTWVF